MAGNQRYKKRKPKGKNHRINLATIIALVVLVYFIARVTVSLTKPRISTYEVSTQSIHNAITVKAMALREEHLVKTTSSGYVIYYVADGERVGVDSSVYAIDRTGNVYSQIESDDGDIDISYDNYVDLKNQINDYKETYSDNTFSSIYDFKYTLNNNIMEMTSDSMISKINKLSKEGNLDSSLTQITSGETGVVSYRYDGKESVTVDNISADDFNNVDNKMTQIRSNNLYDVNSPAYRIITNENWNLVMELSQEQYHELSGEEYLTVKFLKDDFQAERNATFFQRGGAYFVSLSFNKYMERYMNDRYLNVDIITESVSGIKVPKTSLLKEKLYAIPAEYANMADEAVSGVTFNVYSIDDKGNPEVTTVSPTICYYDEKNKLYYVSPTEISRGDELYIGISEEEMLAGKDPDETYTVGKSKEFTGVYLINRGFAQFIVVDILYTADDFVIVDPDMTYGLTEYDHIILDSDAIEEGQIIY